jgi:hypothetical protein
MQMKEPVMNEIASRAGSLLRLGFVLGGVVAVVALLVWLVGLVLVLRGSDPKDRPQILLAYALCRLPIMRQPPIDDHASHRQGESSEGKVAAKTGPRLGG